MMLVLGFFTACAVREKQSDVSLRCFHCRDRKHPSVISGLFGSVDAIRRGGTVNADVGFAAFLLVACEMKMKPHGSFHHFAKTILARV